MGAKLGAKGATTARYLTLLFFGILVISVAIYSYIVSFIVKHGAEVVQQEQTQAVVNLLQAKMESQIHEIKVTANAIGMQDDLSGTEVVNFLKNEQDSDGMQAVKVLSLPGKTIFPGGQVHIDSVEIKGLEKVDGNQTQVFSSVIHGIIDGKEQELFMITAPVVRNGTKAGSLSYVYTSKDYRNLLHTEILGQQGNIIIIGQQGNIILAPDKGQFWQGSSLLTYFEESGEKQLEQLKNDLENREEGFLVYKRQGEKEYFFYQPFIMNDWYLVSVMPESDVIAQSNKIRMIIFAVGIFLMGTLIVLGIYIRWLCVKKQKEIEHAAWYDSIVNLPNNVFLVQHMKGLPEGGKGYAYILLHIQNFEELVGLFGGETGNHTLKMVAEGLSEQLQDKEIACYIQNNTFSLLLGMQDQEQILNRILQLMDDLGKMRVGDGTVEYTFYCKLRCGIYEITGEETSVEEVINMAGMALIDAKNAVDKRYVFFHQKMSDELKKKRMLMERLDQAFQEREIKAYFQPQYELKDISVNGAEVVARWEHPDLGLIRVVDFISLLEVSGKLLDLDLYILEEACKQVKKWVDSERMPVPLWVNISRNNLYEKDFVEKVFMLTQQYNVPTSLIGLEMRADILSLGGDEITEIIERFHERGFLISVDHFAPESSMAILYQYSLHRVKIVDEYLQGAMNSEKIKAGLKNLIAFCNGLQISSCAKGIKKQEEEQLLKDVDCEVVQGPYYAEPFDMEKFENLIF